MGMPRPGSAVGNYPKSMSNAFQGGVMGNAYANSNTASVYMDSGFGYNSNSAANMTIRGAMPLASNTAMMGVPGMPTASGRATPVIGSPSQHIYSGDTYDVMSYAAGPSPPIPQADYSAAFGMPGTMPPAYDPRTSQMMVSHSSPMTPMMMPSYTSQQMMLPQRAASPATMGGMPDYFVQGNGAMMYSGQLQQQQQQMMMMGGGVSDEAIANQVSNIIATADLMTTSKKLVREQLARDIGLSPEETKARQAFINACINSELSKRTGS
ncbi:hypothetical protein LPJ66_008600 [Kickxella alabastrina]|uniref:Uncharacterized protein n=1 Tax=Kickxella alabastrina TaxID=61397 RepID=A0ACC1I661_9FUNG|nr:hypothetical protein LPJ66_008600 [Kickxella alabastrina]